MALLASGISKVTKISPEAELSLCKIPPLLPAEFSGPKAANRTPYPGPSEVELCPNFDEITDPLLEHLHPLRHRWNVIRDSLLDTMLSVFITLCLSGANNTLQGQVVHLKKSLDTAHAQFQIKSERIEALEGCMTELARALGLQPLCEQQDVTGELQYTLEAAKESVATRKTLEVCRPDQINPFHSI